MKSRDPEQRRRDQLAKRRERYWLKKIDPPRTPAALARRMAFLAMLPPEAVKQLFCK